MKISGSGSESGFGFISQMHGSADPDPDPHQNVIDQQHWRLVTFFFLTLINMAPVQGLKSMASLLKSGHVRIRHLSE